MKYTLDARNKKLEELRKKYIIMKGAQDICLAIINLQNPLPKKTDREVEDDLADLESLLKQIHYS